MSKKGQMFSIYVINIVDSEISFYFTLWWTVFELQVIARQVHQITPKDPDHYYINGTPYMSYRYPPGAKFSPFCSTPVILSLQANLR